VKPYSASTLALPGRDLDAADRRRAGAVLAAVFSRDIGLTVTVALALGLSAMSIAYFFHAGVLTAFGDSRARLLIARTVVFGRHPGLAQLGGIWPPFPQVYMLPLVWNDFMYRTGLAGAIPSAVSYVAASAFLYRLVVRLTGDQVAGLISVLAFSGPNILYLQSVPMSEMPFMACFVAAADFMVRWLTDGSLSALFLAGVSACLATLTRYEGWVLMVLLICVVIAAGWRGGQRYDEAEGHLVFFGLVALLGVGFWLVWNRVIFGDTLYFLHSQYGTKAINALEVQAMSASSRAVGHPSLSVIVLFWMIVDNLGWVAVGLAALGLGRLVLMRGRPVQAVVAALLLLFPIGFSVLAIYSGAEVVSDPHATPGVAFTNIRYGLLAAPAAGYLAGWLAQGRWLRWPALAACLASSLLGWQTGVANLQDATTVLTQQAATSTRAGDWLASHYDGGLVLAQRRTNENLLFTSQLPAEQMVYEGDQSEWTLDLARPDREVRWIVMDRGYPEQGGVPDAVWASLHGSGPLRDHYALVYEDGPIQIYRSLAA
jgi:hypothetical protein